MQLLSVEGGVLAAVPAATAVMMMVLGAEVDAVVAAAAAEDAVVLEGDVAADGGVVAAAVAGEGLARGLAFCLAPEVCGDLQHTPCSNCSFCFYNLL